VSLTAGAELVRVRLGGTALLIGATGRGKSSLKATMLIEHATNCGPAIVMSLELPDDEWTARGIGTQCDASWFDVLTGKLDRESMVAALPERLYILPRDASLDEVTACVDAAQKEHSNEPIVVGIDYAQLIEMEGPDQERLRIGKVMRAVDKIAREKRIVVLALSQGSRVSSRGLTSGERIGSDTTDAGAESADLERWASCTIAIGAHGPEGDDGTCTAEISIGKSRMGRGDRVVPARYCGRSGLWRIEGESRAASDVRAERKAQRTDQKTNTTALAVSKLLSESKSPMSGADIKRTLGGDGSVIYAAIAMLLKDGSAVRVRGKRTGGAWPLWTPERAAEYSIDLVPEGA
jgi:hypothetical protein